MEAALLSQGLDLKAEIKDGSNVTLPFHKTVSNFGISWLGYHSDSTKDLEGFDIYGTEVSKDIREDDEEIGPAEDRDDGREHVVVADVFAL
jgi:hypothetical protein